MEITFPEAKIGEFAMTSKIVPYLPDIAGNPSAPGGCPMNGMTTWIIRNCLGWFLWDFMTIEHEIGIMLVEAALLRKNMY